MIYINNQPAYPDNCPYCGREIKVIYIDRSTTVAQMCCAFCGGPL